MSDPVQALSRLIREGPDPEVAVRRLVRFGEIGGALPTEPREQALLASLLASGTFLPELLFSDISGWARLTRDPYLEHAKPADVVFSEAETATAAATDFADFKRRLRIYRRGEMLRLGARELGLGTTEEVSGELSALADAALELSYRYCDAELRRELGTPISDDPEEPVAFVVLAMGKLGGEELNFSSDVDVIYFYSTDAGSVTPPPARAATEPRTLHAYYAELSHRITQAIEEATAEGFVFRVDLRLRPEGRNGPLCNSLVAAERYYETFGRTWERQALLRARPAAGDRAFGERLLAMLEPFVFRRHTDTKTLDEVRKLRALFVPGGQSPGHEGRTGGQNGADAAAFDVKLGTGGIRDVELVVQSLQLLYGGRRRDVRERHTPRALLRLRVAGLLTDREARALASSYRFWRQVEHRIQMTDGAQTHRLPADPAARAVIARSLGFESLEAFDAEVATRRAEVEAIARTFDDPAIAPAARVQRPFVALLDRDELEAALADLGFADPESSADAVELVRGRLPVELFAEAVASPDPDRALGHFRELTLRGSTGLLTLLRDEPQLRRMLATLFGVSERLSRVLVAYPDLWAPFLDGLGEAERSREALAAALERRLGALSDSDPDLAEEEEARELRKFQTEELLRIGLHDVAGTLPVRSVARQLTELAEVCLTASLDRVIPRVYSRLGRPAADLTVLGLGSLGAFEMRYGSDLDLVFLYSEEGEVAGGRTHAEIFAKLARRLIGGVGAVIERGRLYEIDTRLRPSGEQGLLVSSYRAFERYHAEEAAWWERVALLRARVVYTTADANGRGRVEDLLSGVAYGRPIDQERFRADLRHVRERVVRERGRVPPGAVHLRFDPGGIMDIEFLTALGQLEHGASDVTLQTTETAAVLTRLIERGWSVDLGRDHDLLRSLAMRMRLLRDRPEDVIGPGDFISLARSYERDPERLRDELGRAMSRIRSAYLSVFGT